MITIVYRNRTFVSIQLQLENKKLQHFFYQYILQIPHSDGHSHLHINYIINNELFFLFFIRHSHYNIASNYYSLYYHRMFTNSLLGHIRGHQQIKKYIEQKQL